ncbi:MAG: ABC transporter ATP-binding protein/permease [Candidatus Gastranaerophilales bacterium]|nr:ABC transporter ATP-binding protein/permease [Candidatus Gastranaerophilales bacterium]
MFKLLQKKGVRYVGYVLRDFYRFLPVALCISLLLAMIDPILSIWNPLLIADIFELVGDLGPANMGIFQRDILLLCIMAGISQGEEVLYYYFQTLLIGKKESYFGWKIFEHAGKIRLEDLEDPKVLDTFKKAELAYTEYTSSVTFFMTLLNSVTAVAVCVGMVFVVGSFSLWLIPGALLGVIPHFILSVWQEKELARVHRGQASLRRRLTYLWQQFCRKESVKEMRVMGFGEYLKQKWVETNLQVIDEIRQVRLKGLKRFSTADIVKNACYAANVAIALYLMVKGRLAVGQFAACLTAFATLQGTLLRCYRNFSNAAEMYHRQEEYYDFFELEPEEDGEKEYRPFADKISLKDVHFRYQGSDRDALQGVDMEIKKGEHVVIVGVNGSGKTTLSKLLAGAYRVSSGEVAYDGRNVNDFRRESLYRDISLVPQDFVHYNFTFRENVCISDIRHREDDERLQRIIGQTELSEVVQSIGGVDVQLGREFDGSELSGGEWQKIAIARGVFKDCSLIILDEPTSALDPMAEYDILTGFLKLIQDKTSVIISHRVGICREADKVIVMKDGRVAECGTHRQLKDAGGEYSRIWREQAKWYQ